MQPDRAVKLTFPRSEPYGYDIMADGQYRAMLRERRVRERAA